MNFFVILLAIRVALAYGLEVYTTVSTPQKRKFILSLFPQLKGMSTFFVQMVVQNLL